MDSFATISVNLLIDLAVPPPKIPPAAAPTALNGAVAISPAIRPAPAAILYGAVAIFAAVDAANLNGAVAALPAAIAPL